ncbi:11567_t:CDS:2, partial [Scutellospora calospora]
MLVCPSNDLLLQNDGRNARSSSNDLLLQNNDQILAINNPLHNFYQSSSEFNLNLEEPMSTYQECENNSENCNDFDDNLEVDKFGNRLEYENELVDSLEYEDKLVNSLESGNEFEGGLSEDEFMTRLEYDDKNILEIYDNYDNGSESDSYISTTYTSSMDNE